MNPIISPRENTRRDTAQQIRREITARFTAERAPSNFWRRLALRWAIERAVAAELKRRFPPGALYVHNALCAGRPR